MESALYFPYIRVPQTSWFTQVLLYWDNAASIVPRNYDKQVGTYMRELIKEGLVRPVRPDNIVSTRYYEFNQGGFLAWLDRFNLPRIDNYSVQEHWTRLHSGKASREMFNAIADRGLAFPLDDPQWWGVEKKTADLYMNYLLGFICEVEGNLFPVTDTRYSLTSLMGPADDHTGSRLNKLRYAAITQALPAPSGHVPPAELASFKDRHDDELRRLRHYLDRQLYDLAWTDDDSERRAKTERVLQEIRHDVEKLAADMKRRDWPRIAFGGVGGLIASAAIIGGAIATGGTALMLGFGIAAGIASIGPGVFAAKDFIGSSRFDEGAPLAYAALAQAL